MNAYVSRINIVWEVSTEASFVAVVKVDENKKDKENSTNCSIDAEDENGSMSLDQHATKDSATKTSEAVMYTL